MSQNKFTTNNNPTLVAVSNADGETPVYLYANPSTHGLVVDAVVSVDTTGLATDTNQTNGAQKTQIVDAGGEAVTVTGGKLDVNATTSLAGEALPIAGATTAVGVAIVDSSGDQVSSFGGGTQYTEGDITDPAVGTAVLGRRLSDGSLNVPRLDDSDRIDVTASEALQVDNTNFADINSKIPALGQAVMAASSPVVIASNQSAIPVTGIATELPTETDNYVGIRTLPQVKKRYGFDKVIADDVDTDMTLLLTGTGQTVNQSGGSLVITSGTTARAESIIRSNDFWKDAVTLRYSSILSQRIVNNNFYIELVDVIGDNLAYTISSATILTVTIPSNPFTSANVGQSVYIGAFAGTGTFLSGRYPIASVAGDDVTFTVASFAAGTGTCSAFGWNYHHVLYTSTTATNATFGTQRKGWQTADITATINTTASPGHVGVFNIEDGISVYLDQLAASATTVQSAIRAQNVRNVPEADTPLYLQIRCANGSTNPASTTTWTVGFVDIENYVTQQVSINSVRPSSYNHALPVSVQGTPATTITSGTVTTLTNITNWGNVVDNGAFVDGTTRLMPGGYIFDEVAGTALTENDAAAARIDSKRAQVLTIEDATTRGRRATVTATNRLQVEDQDTPTGTTLVPYSVRITTNTTTTPVASTAYISSIVVSSEAAGTTSTLTIQDKQGTPLKLINGLTTVAITTTPTVLNFQTPVQMTSGIDIITAGVAAATVDVWINYYQ